MPKVYKLIGLFIILLFFLGLGFLAVSYQKRVWKDDSRLTYYDLFQIRSFDPITKESVIINLPQNLEVESTDGRGVWLLGKIAKAGLQKWVSESLRWHFGIADLKDRNDLTAWDWWSLRKYSPRSIDLIQTGLVTLEKTSDGLDIYRLSPHWYLQSSDWFASTNIVRQNLTVTVINTTAVTGVGSRVTRALETIGLKVQTLASSQDNRLRCRLTYSSQVKKMSGFIFMKTLFNCENLINESLGLEIKLELGQDWAGILFGG